jgi:FMN reductase
MSIARNLGCDTEVFPYPSLGLLPHFDISVPSSAATDLASLLARSDGVVCAAPGYHGAISGSVKTALDWCELLRTDSYLSGRPVVPLAAAADRASAGVVLTQLREVFHELRGWVVPSACAFASGDCTAAALQNSDSAVARTLDRAINEMYWFVSARAGAQT